MPEFAEYGQITEFSFYDAKRWLCLNDSGDTFEDWRKCVAPGAYVSVDCVNNNSGALVCEQKDRLENRPPELRRGYTIWGQYGATIATTISVLLILLGVGYFLHRKRLASNDR